MEVAEYRRGSSWRKYSSTCGVTRGGGCKFGAGAGAGGGGAGAAEPEQGRAGAGQGRSRAVEVRFVGQFTGGRCEWQAGRRKGVERMLGGYARTVARPTSYSRFWARERELPLH